MQLGSANYQLTDSYFFIIDPLTVIAFRIPFILYYGRWFCFMEEKKKAPFER